MRPPTAQLRPDDPFPRSRTGRGPSSFTRCLAFSLLAAILSGCRERPEPPQAPIAAPPQAALRAAPEPPKKKPATAAPEPPSIRFRDATAASGLRFVARSGNSPEKHTPTINGSGVALLDYDRDGLIDVYMATTRDLPLDGPTSSKGNRLFRNLGGGRFADVTAAAGVGFHGFTHGLAAADLDNDGFTDLYLANLGPDALYWNNGDGTFRLAGAEANIADDLWSSAACPIDFDNDGLLDIYVSTYAKWAYDAPRLYCGDSKRKLRMYCSPKTMTPERHRLLRNRGDGSFEDVTESAGVLRTDGRGMGVLATDLDGDGRIDLFVANDSCPNFVFLNRGDGTFEDIGTVSGASATEAGFFQAGMGVDAEDVNGDGRPDILLTTYRGEYDTLYRNIDGRTFQDVSSSAGITRDSLPDVGWGCALADLDNDGLPDILVANGHVDDNLIPLGLDDVEQPESTKVWRNTGNGRFRFVKDPGPFFQTEHVARGAGFGDLDGDGRTDVVISMQDEPATVLLNESAPRHWVGFDLIGRGSNKTSIGAAVTLTAGGKTYRRQVKGGGSYLSSNDPRLLFGLGDTERVDRVEVRWPSGAKLIATSPEPGRYHTLREPELPKPEGAP